MYPFILIISINLFIQGPLLPAPQQHHPPGPQGGKRPANRRRRGQASRLRRVGKEQSKLIRLMLPIYQCIHMNRLANGASPRQNPLGLTDGQSYI